MEQKLLIFVIEKGEGQFLNKRDYFSRSSSRSHNKYTWIWNSEVRENCH